MAHVDVFEALADPTRRRIVEVLRGGERPVNDVVERLSIHQSGVSRHLHILLEAGFVQMRPDGQRRLYSLRPEPFQALDAWVAEYRSVWEARLQRFDKAIAERRRARAAGKSATKQSPAKPKEKQR